MRRARGPLTPDDLATVKAFELSLRASYRAGVEAVAGLGEVAESLRDSVRYAASAAAMVRTFDAAPRHRHLPSRATVMEWLDRHAPPVQLVDDPIGRLPLGVAAQHAADDWFVRMGEEVRRREAVDPGAFAREREGNWREYRFDQPVEVRAGVEYVVEYPPDGLPVDVDRDRGGPYRSMWPGGIGG